MDNNVGYGSSISYGSNSSPNTTADVHVMRMKQLDLFSRQYQDQDQDQDQDHECECECECECDYGLEFNFKSNFNSKSNSNSNSNHNFNSNSNSTDRRVFNGSHLSGRPIEVSNVVSSNRLKEVARLVVQGYKSHEIADMLRIGVFRVNQLIKQAEEEGISTKLSDARDEFTRKMEDKLRRVAEDSVAIIQARLDGIKNDINNPDIDDKDALDSRALNDAFRAFDKTDLVTKKDKVSNDNKTTNIIALFGNDALERAKEASNRIFDVERGK